MALSSLPLRPPRVHALVEQCSLRSWVHGAGLTDVGVVGRAAGALHSVHRQFKCVEVVSTSLAIFLSGEPKLRAARDTPLIRTRGGLYPVSGRGCGEG